LRTIFGAVIGSFALVSAASAASPPGALLSNFPSEKEAREHCPKDTVVWLNLPIGIYHYKGERWYGNTIGGAYVCRGEADQAGDRASK
jgi:hypothetical protein